MPTLECPYIHFECLTFFDDIYINSGFDSENQRLYTSTSISSSNLLIRDDEWIISRVGFKTHLKTNANQMIGLDLENSTFTWNEVNSGGSIFAIHRDCITRCYATISPTMLPTSPPELTLPTANPSLFPSNIPSVSKNSLVFRLASSRHSLPLSWT